MVKEFQFEIESCTSSLCVHYRQPYLFDPLQHIRHSLDLASLQLH